MATLSFVKYSGNGNDFVILDHPPIDITPSVVRRLCDRHFGVGADGVLILGTAPEHDGSMRIINADGGEVEMCGNGVRCLASFIDTKSQVKKDTYRIKTMNATYEVKRTSNGSFGIEMSEIKDKNSLDLKTLNEFEKSFYVNTGVPHLVFLSNDVKKIDIKNRGSFYRHHPLFLNGTNVNFVQVTGDKKAYVRTYERGVEDETFSCGTGLTASALALSHWFDWSGAIQLQNLGGNQTVEVGNSIFYSGEVTFCFKGELHL